MGRLKTLFFSYKAATQKDKILTFTISFVFWVCMLMGQMIEKTGYLVIKDVRWGVYLCLLTPASSILLCLFYEWLEKYVVRRKKESALLKKKEIILSFSFFMICWGIVLLGVFPGFFLYDAQDELNQVLTRIFTTHHPIFHVLYMGGIVQAGNKILGGYNAGICLLMLFQMSCFAAGFTYLIYRMRQIGVSKKICMFAAAFLGLFPVIPMMVLCSSKDAVFSLFMLLWLIDTYMWQESERSQLSIQWYIWSALLVLLRNNAVYALLIVGVTTVCLQKKHRKIMLKGLLISIIIAKIVSMGLETIFHADSTEYQEILTVPIQQLTRVHHLEPDRFTQEEKDILYQYLPEEYLKKYEPKLSDSVKIGFQNEYFKENKTDFLKLWVDIGKKAPMSYLNAWLLTSYGYWYPEATIDVYKGHTVYTFTYKDSSYFGYETEQPGLRYSLIPAIDNMYRFLSLENWKEKFPLLYLFFSPGCMFWVMIWGVGFLWKINGIEKGFPYSCSLFIVATLLLGPTFLPRYVFFLWPCNLFLIGEILTGDKR